MVLVVLVFLVAGALAVLLLGRSRLDDSQAKVDKTWTPLRSPLAQRYLKLAAVDTALRDAGGGDRAVAGDLDGLLEQWAREQRAKEIDPEAETDTANQLEGVARRVVAAYFASPRLQEKEALGAAITEFGAAAVPTRAIDRYNDAVGDYQGTRDSALWSPAAKLLGYDARPVLTLTP